MTRDQNKDRRFFIDLEIKTLKVVNHGYDHKKNLDSGRQPHPERHRIFLTEGQYNKFIKRCDLKAQQNKGSF